MENRNKLKELVTEIMRDTNRTKTSIAIQLNYGSLAAFCQALDKGGIPQRKVDKLLRVYGYDNEYKKI